MFSAVKYLVLKYRGKDVTYYPYSIQPLLNSIYHLNVDLPSFREACETYPDNKDSFMDKILIDHSIRDLNRARLDNFILYENMNELSVYNKVFLELQRDLFKMNLKKDLLPLLNISKEGMEIYKDYF